MENVFLDIFGYGLSFGLYCFVASFFLAGITETYLGKLPADDTVLQLIGRILYIPFYIFVVPLLGVIGIFSLIGVLIDLLKEKGVTGAVAKFFNKKPLEFLKNYSIRIEKK